MPEKVDSTFIERIPVNLNKLRNNKVFCDVILRSGMREVYAHRIMLVTLSDYFTLLFKYEGGIGKPTIEFDEDMITEDCLESIVSYAYTGKINICTENVCALFVSSAYFDIPFIKSECVKFLNELPKEIINLDNLPSLIYMACYYNLSTILEPICILTSKYFAKTSVGDLLNISPHSLLTLLKEKNFTVLYNDIPANDIDFELFKLVVNYTSKHDLPDHIITELLQMIQLSQISLVSLDDFFSIVDSFPRIRNNEEIVRVSNFRALSSFVNREDTGFANMVERKYSRSWKYIGGLKPDEVLRQHIDIDDRIGKIKIYTITGIPSAKIREKSSKTRFCYAVPFDTILENDEDFASIKGISLIYKSGKNVTIGDTSEENVFPLDEACTQEYTLDEKEVVVKISITKKGAMLKSIKFVTNCGNIIRSTTEDHFSPYHYLQTFSPKTKCGYFHSFRRDSTIDSLQILWIEYMDPILRESEQQMQRRIQKQMNFARTLYRR